MKSLSHLFSFFIIFTLIFSNSALAQTCNVTNRTSLSQEAYEARLATFEQRQEALDRESERIEALPDGSRREARRKREAAEQFQRSFEALSGEIDRFYCENEIEGLPINGEAQTRSQGLIAAINDADKYEPYLNFMSLRIDGDFYSYCDVPRNRTQQEFNQKVEKNYSYILAPEERIPEGSKYRKANQTFRASDIILKCGYTAAIAQKGCKSLPTVTSIPRMRKAGDTFADAEDKANEEAFSKRLGIVNRINELKKKAEAGDQESSLAYLALQSELKGIEFDRLIKRVEAANELHGDLSGASSRARIEELIFYLGIALIANPFTIKIGLKLIASVSLGLVVALTTGGFCSNPTAEFNLRANSGRVDSSGGVGQRLLCNPRLPVRGDAFSLLEVAQITPVCSVLKPQLDIRKNQNDEMYCQNIAKEVTSFSSDFIGKLSFPPTRTRSIKRLMRTLRAETDNLQSLVQEHFGEVGNRINELATQIEPSISTGIQTGNIQSTPPTAIGIGVGEVNDFSFDSTPINNPDLQNFSLNEPIRLNEVELGGVSLQDRRLIRTFNRGVASSRAGNIQGFRSSLGTLQSQVANRLRSGDLERNFNSFVENGRQGSGALRGRNGIVADELIANAADIRNQLRQSAQNNSQGGANANASSLVSNGDSQGEDEGSKFNSLTDKSNEGNSQAGSLRNGLGKSSRTGAVVNTDSYDDFLDENSDEKGINNPNNGLGENNGSSGIAGSGNSNGSGSSLSTSLLADRSGGSEGNIFKQVTKTYHRNLGKFLSSKPGSKKVDPIESAKETEKSQFDEIFKSF